MSDQPLLVVDELKVNFTINDGVIKAVDGSSFSIRKGEIVGLAGESGCGKSVTTQAILRLVPSPGEIIGGRILLNSENILEMSASELRNLRGNRISIVHQDALAALNPVISVGEQVADIYRDHKNISMKQALQTAIEMMRKVGIPLPESRARQFAHEYSGGMQQRAVISSALICQPDLIIADEPTTALDVTIQMQILAILKHAQEEMGSAVLYISHDLANVARICDRVMIMYAGEIVEQAMTSELYQNPLHPYTQGLLNSIPPMGGKSQKLLPAIKGNPPKPTEYPPGCRFAARCSKVHDRCTESRPDLIEQEDGRSVRCFLYEEQVDVRDHQS
jgi:oligopeptide/dipeptide ABC transporter ATP-binding protein